MSDINDIEPVDIKYSKFSVSLDKIFKGKSIEDLQIKLKNDDLIKRGYKNKITQKYREKDEKLTIFPQIQQQIENSKSLEKNKPLHNNLNTKSDTVILPKIKNKNIEPFLYPYPGKYNPNYAAIDKNIPGISMKLNTEPSIREKLLKQEVSKSIELSNRKVSERNQKGLLSKQDSEKLNSGIKKPSEEKLSLSIDAIRAHTESNNQSKILNSKILPSSPSLIRGITFEKYSSRKSMIKPGFNDILTYLEPRELKLNSFDFNKMAPREEKLSNGNSNPSICYYNPNYHCIEKNVPSIIPFTKRSPQNLENKKFKLQKLWRSYNVTSEYLMVKF